ncbi:MAG: hypothetical protein ACLPN1_10165 [Dissulfurispiraceae bacterium]
MLIGDYLDADTTQKVATRSFNAVSNHSIGKKSPPRLKGKRQIDSRESKANAAGIRYWDG